jgi:8-hydroxy-5-deazaflavin:NADPH oxidoreductase
VQMTIAIVGGTGAEGSGLAARFAKAGVEVRIGSRRAQKAEETARRIGPPATGHANTDAVATAEIVILAVPLAAQVETLKSIRPALAPGAILVDATVPLEVAIGGRVSRVLTLWDGSAAQQAARLLPGIPVVAAFHALSAEALARLDHPLDCDALICGDHAEAKTKIARLAEMIPGVRAIDAGTLDNARLLEYAAALLISLNLRHKVKESGMRITGL